MAKALDDVDKDTTISRLVWLVSVAEQRAQRAEENMQAFAMDGLSRGDRKAYEREARCIALGEKGAYRNVLGMIRQNVPVSEIDRRVRAVLNVD